MLGFQNWFAWFDQRSFSELNCFLLKGFCVESKLLKSKNKIKPCYKDAGEGSSSTKAWNPTNANTPLLSLLGLPLGYEDPCWDTFASIKECHTELMGKWWLQCIHRYMYKSWNIYYKIMKFGMGGVAAVTVWLSMPADKRHRENTLQYSGCHLSRSHLQFASWSLSACLFRSLCSLL